MVLSSLFSEGMIWRGVCDVESGWERVMSGGVDMTVRVWDVVNGAAVAVSRTSWICLLCAFSVDGERAIRQAETKQYESGILPVEHPARLRGHQERCKVAFSPDGERVVSVGKDQRVLIWQERSGRVITAFNRHHKGDVCEVAFNPAGTHLIGVGGDSLIVWGCRMEKSVLSFYRRKKNSIRIAKF